MPSSTFQLPVGGTYLRHSTSIPTPSIRFVTTAASKSARIHYQTELTRHHDDDEVLSYKIEFSQNPNTQNDPTYTIQNEEMRIGDRVLFSRSDDILKLKGLSNIYPEGRSIFAAIRRADGFKEFTKNEPLVAHCAREISRIGAVSF